MARYNYPNSFLKGGSATSGNQGKLPPNYGSLGTGKFRHEASFATDGFEGDLPSMLNLGSYFMVQNLQFSRTFDFPNPDVPPTPTVSNNLAGSNFFNGSYATNFRSNIRIKNQDSVDTVTLDVFNIALSYYDAKIWDDIRPDSCPVTFLNSGDANDGVVIPKSTPSLPTDLSMQDWNNFKFQQHYMQHLGTVTIGDVQGDNIIELTQTRIPPKCRRSQTGLYWATLFLYDATKNTDNTANLEVNQELKWEEHPSENRLPFIT